MAETSILIPAYNNPKDLARALNSCFEQDYSDYEIIVTDDSTNDENEKIVKEFQKTHSSILYFHNKEPLGSPKNWNYALSKAGGKYIKFLHHDDWFASPDSLRKFVRAFEEHPEADFVFCQSADIDDNNKKQYHDFEETINKAKDDIYTIFPNNCIGAPSVTMYKKNSLRFDENLIWLVDIDFYLRILQQNPNFVYVPDICVNIGLGKSRITWDCCKNPDIEPYENFYVYNKYKKYFKNNYQKLLFLKKIIKPYRNSYIKKFMYMSRLYFYFIEDFIIKRISVKRYDESV